MPLPVIFKFLSDTTGLRFNEVNRGFDGVNVSSQKAASAVKSFASVIRSGQEPVGALADSLLNFSRALKIGIGGTIAIVAVSEAMKSLIEESQRVNAISEKLNSSLKAIRENSGRVDLNSAISQVKSLAAAIADANEQYQKTGGDFVTRAGRTIADLLGVSDYTFRFTSDLARQEMANARYDVKRALQQEIELMNVKKKGEFAVKELQINREAYDLQKKLKSISADRETNQLAEILRLYKLGELEEEQIKKKKEADEEQKKRDEETAKARQKAIDEAIKKEEELRQKQKQALADYTKGIEDIQSKRLAGAGTLLDRIAQSAKILGLSGVGQFIEAGRAGRETKRSEELIKQTLGIDPFFARGRRSIPGGAEGRLTSLLDLEAEGKRQEDMRTYESVYNIERAVSDLKKVIEERLGVTILRSAN